MFLLSFCLLELPSLRILISRRGLEFLDQIKDSDTVPDFRTKATNLIEAMLNTITFII